MDIVIYFGILFGCSLRTDGCSDYLLVLSSYSWRTDVIILDYLLMLSSRLCMTEVI